MRGLRPLRYRDFALYWSGLTVSQVGDWMETTTTAWLLYEITRSPVLLGLGGGIRALAVVAFGLIGGAVVDRVPRRRLLLITQSGFVSYAAILVALGAMRSTDAVPRARGSLLREVAAGPRYLLARPVLRSLLVLELVPNLFGLNTAMLTILASDVLRVGPQGLGLLLSMQAVGSLVATGTLITVGDIERNGRAMVAAGVGYAGALALLPLASTPPVAGGVVPALGLTDSFWATMRNTVFQLTTDESYRGRTMGLLLLTGRAAARRRRRISRPGSPCPREVLPSRR